MMGGFAETTITAAARHADVWSVYARTSSLPEAFVELTAPLDQIDPADSHRIGATQAPRAAVRIEEHAVKRLGPRR